MLRGKKAIIFDFDGSLVDSMWLWKEVDIIYTKKYHLTLPSDYYQKTEGMSYTETAQYYIDTFPAFSCTLEEIKQEWEDMTLELYKTKVPLKSGAKEFLKKMKDKGVLLGIASSNSQALVVAALQALQVLEYFTSIRTACEVCAGKPAPDVYLKVAEDLQISPQECLVFEDVPKGIEAGKNAGMTVCAVDDDFSRCYEAEKRRLADFYIHDYYDILRHTYEKC